MPVMTVRYFGAKKRRGRKSPDVPTEDESEEVSGAAEEEVQHEEPVAQPVPEPTPVARTPEPQAALARDLFQPFSVGDIKQIDSAPGDQAPSKEDTIEGRYAGVLFTTAS